MIKLDCYLCYKTCSELIIKLILNLYWSMFSNIWNKLLLSTEITVLVNCPSTLRVIQDDLEDTWYSTPATSDKRRYWRECLIQLSMINGEPCDTCNEENMWIWQLKCCSEDSSWIFVRDVARGTNYVVRYFVQ